MKIGVGKTHNLHSKITTKVVHLFFKSIDLYILTTTKTKFIESKTALAQMTQGT